jgi:competence protein ComEA
MRWLYQLQQRLAITRNEAIALLTLSGLFLAGLAAQHLRTHGVRFEALYEASDQEFAAFTARLDSLHQAQQARAEEARPDANREASTGGASAPSSAAPGATAPVPINTASAAALETLPGIGPALAGRILEYRALRGGFRRIDELGRVRGIGPKTLDRLRPLVTTDRP